MSNFAAYRLLSAKSKELGWPTHFRKDLTEIIRLQFAKKDAPTVFGFGIRAAGCDLYRIENADYLEQALFYMRPGSRNLEQHYFVKNESAVDLCECSLPEFVRWLAQRLNVKKHKQDWEEANQKRVHASVYLSKPAYEEAARLAKRAERRYHKAQEYFEHYA